MGNTLMMTTYMFSEGLDLYITSKYMNYFLGKLRVSRKKAGIIYIICYILGTVQYLKLPVPLINMAASFTILLFVALCYEKRPYKVILAMLLVFMFQFAGELIVSLATGGGNVQLVEYGYNTDVFQLICLQIAQVIVYFIITSFKNVNSGLSLPLSFNISIIMLNGLFLLLEILIFMQRGVQRTVKLVSVLCMIVVLLLIMYLYDIVSRSYVNMLQAKLFERENMYYIKQAEVLQKNNDNIRKFRHDINNHLYVLDSMLDEENNTRKAKKYIENLVGKLNKVKMYSSSGNIQLDSIVNYKLSEANEKDIEVSSDVKLPNECHIDMNDMVTILGNIIDNSIEAVEKLDERRYIDLKIKYQIGTILINLKNSYDGNIKLKNGTIKTLKRNSMEHGIGLKSVEEAVQKYDGAVKIDYDDKEFRVKIVLYIDEQK